MEIGPRNQEGPLLPITALATLPTNDGSATLVLGDAAGRLRITRFRSDEGNAVDLDEYLNLQLRSTDGTVLSIVCIEPLSESLLAVSTRQLGGGLHQESQPPPTNYIDINVPVGQALHIIDLVYYQMDVWQLVVVRWMPKPEFGICRSYKMMKGVMMALRQQYGARPNRRSWKKSSMYLA
jgi:hypothetical protein